MVEDRSPKIRPEKFGSLLPLIPGALLTMIGIIVWLFHKVNGTIFCYLGVMGMLVGAGQIWTQSVQKLLDLDAHKQADHEPPKEPHHIAAGGRARIQNAMRIQNAILVGCCVVGAVITGLAIICVATLTTFKGGTAPGLFGGLASLFSGGLIGFLFSVPSEQQQPNSTLLINTSLNQIAEWLTKIIVGVSLVNVQTAYHYFVVATNTLGAGLTTSATLQPAAKAFAAGLIVTFFFLGFTGAYLLTRLWISGAIVLADQLALRLSSGLQMVTVPNVVGSTQDAATTAIKAAKLMVGTVTPQSSDAVASGIVMSQDPASASTVLQGSPVNLVISSGPPQAVTVPNVVGSAQDAATTAIKAAKLIVGTVTPQTSDTVASGIVISQDPVSAGSVSPGSPINLVISSGPQQAVTVPNVVGSTQDAATTAIKAAKLIVGTVTAQTSDTVASGLVMSQDPASASSVSPGSAVNLVISSGPQHAVT